MRLLKSSMKLAFSQSVKRLEIPLLRGSECSGSRVAKLIAKLCEFHICNIFAPAKFGVTSIFRPVFIFFRWQV